MQEEFYQQAIKHGVENVRRCPWIEDELGSADFGDSRLRLRFLVIAQSLSRFPQAFINQASELWPRAKAAYRFFDNKHVTAPRVLAPHQRQTARRIKNHRETILVIQDGSFLNYSHMKTSSDLGNSGRFKQACLGLNMHTGLAITEHGLPLGIISQEFWVRKGEKLTLSEKRRRKMEERESFVWIRSLKEYHKILGGADNVVTVCDRGADMYELFKEASSCKAKFLIRASNDRVLSNGERLWEHVKKNTPKVGFAIQIEAQKDLPSRVAKVELRFCTVSIPVPCHNVSDENPEALHLDAVLVSEVDPPTDVKEPIEWMLLTNVPTTDTAAALNRVDWYSRRWMIEVFHKVLKSGCHIEYSRLAKNSRRLPFIALKSIIAWKLLLLTYFQRLSPTEPATRLLSSLECKALYLAIHDAPPKRLRLNVNTATRWLAHLGGFLGRKSDNQPGVTAVWRGWHRLQDYARILAASQACS